MNIVNNNVASLEPLRNSHKLDNLHAVGNFIEVTM
jgi:hypothetical protein